MLIWPDVHPTIYLPGKQGECRLPAIPTETKKAHPMSQMSFEYFVQILEAVNLTYRSANRRMELAPFLFSSWISQGGKKGGCQGFIGPLPSAFLDK